MTGPLGIAETAILGSTLAWGHDGSHEAFEQPRRWSAGPGYAVTAQGDNPRYWTARAPDATELAAGAGDFGLAKCIRSCERHAQTSASEAKAAASNNGIAYSECSVTLVQPEDPWNKETGAHCQWMPFQVGQAAKTEAAERQVAQLRVADIGVDANGSPVPEGEQLSRDLTEAARDARGG